MLGRCGIERLTCDRFTHIYAKLMPDIAYVVLIVKVCVGTNCNLALIAC